MDWNSVNYVRGLESDSRMGVRNDYNKSQQNPMFGQRIDLSKCQKIPCPICVYQNPCALCSGDGYVLMSENGALFPLDKLKENG